VHADPSQAETFCVRAGEAYREAHTYEGAEGVHYSFTARLPTLPTYLTMSSHKQGYALVQNASRALKGVAGGQL
jgi:hypothetical protein